MRVRLFLGIVFALLVVPAVASAKGPDALTIDGKGLAAPISVDRQGNDDDVMGLGDAAGFFPAVFSQVPDPMLPEAPTKDLGPKLTLTWRVPSSETTADTLRQDVYPYAAGGPLTYTEPGQRFYETNFTNGGWFKASPTLTTTLTRLGVPDRATLEGAAASKSPAVLKVAEATTPAPTATAASASARTSPWPVIALIAAVVLGVTLTTTRTVAARRRTRVAPA